jgi:hypothetical protein
VVMEKPTERRTESPSPSSQDAISDALQSILFPWSSGVDDDALARPSVKDLKKLASLVRRKQINLSEDVSESLASQLLEYIVCYIVFQFSQIEPDFTTPCICRLVCLMTTIRMTRMH